MIVLRVIQWLFYLPLHVIVIALRYPLAPIAVLLFSSKDKRSLTFMHWLETIDNDLSGDEGWKTVHIKPGSDPLSYRNRVGWLWRNGGNRFNYTVIGCKVKPLPRSDGYWMIHQLFGKVELFWGWGIDSNNNGYSKFTFTTRIRWSK